MNADRPEFNIAGSKLHNRVIGLLLILVTLVVFIPVKDHGFVEYDDNIYVTQNPRVNTGLRPENIAWAFASAHSANWHPVTWLSHQLDCTLFDLDPGWHHLTSLMIHILNVVLLFVVLVRLTANSLKSGFVAALFAIHPQHVESVAWVAERKDVLFGFFWMLTLWAYLGYVRQPCLRRYGWVLLFFLLGLLSKPMIVTLPFVLILLDFWPLGRFGSGYTRQGAFVNRPLVEKMPLLALMAGSCFITFLVQQSAGAVGNVEIFPFYTRMGNAIISYVMYLKMMLIPTGLAVLYPHPGAVETREVITAGFILASFSGLAIYVRRRFPYLLVGWLWYMGTLVPVIGIVQIGMQSMADRYTYIPMVGIWIALTWGGGCAAVEMAL